MLGKWKRDFCCCRILGLFNQLDSLFQEDGTCYIYKSFFVCKRFTRVRLAVNTNLAKIVFKYSHNGEKCECLNNIRIKLYPLDRTKCTMPYAPPQQQSPMARRIRMPAIPTGKIMVYFLDFHRQENTMMTFETLTHFRGRDSRIEVPSCPRSFHGYWIRTWVINLLLKRYSVVTEWIQKTQMVNILLKR